MLLLSLTKIDKYIYIYIYIFMRRKEDSQCDVFGNVRYHVLAIVFF